MPISDTPVTNADILKEMRDWSGVHESDRGLRDAIKAAGGIDPLTTAWCAAYVNMALDDLGIQGTESNLAKSFKTIGRSLDAPVPGAIAVFNRGNPNSIFGHVGVVSRVNPGTGTMDIIGGNQKNRVTTETRPIADAIAFRDASLPAYSAADPNSRFNTPSEVNAARRAAEAVRADMLRDDAVVTAPYWDGSNNTTPSPADMSATTNPSLSPIGSTMSADPYDMGQSTAANAVQAPADFGMGMESANAGYSEPVASSFGGMLADRAAPMDTYSTGGSFGADRMPDNFSGGMEQANAGFGGWAPDAGAVANFAGGLESANRGYGGGLPESYASGPVAPDNFAGSLEASNAGTGIFDSYSTGGGFGADRMPDNFAGGLEAANAGQIGAFDTAPTRGFSAPDRAIDVGWGVGAREDRSAPAPSAPAPMDFGPVDIGGLSSSMPSSRMTERAAPMVDPFASMPQQSYPLDDVPAFAETPPAVTSIAAPAAASRPSTAISRPSGVSAPNRPSAAPTRAMAPSLPAPINVAMPAISPSFGPGLTQGLSQVAETLNTYGAPNDFLGSIVGGGADQRAASVGALNAATGQDWSGTARVAAGDDVFAQPAMLGMGNAYAQATGQQGYKSLFDGLSMPSFGFGGSSPASSGWGTGGLYDPSGAGGLYDTSAASGGLFSGFGFSNPFDGMFSGGGNGGGYGNTPGAGGLY
jgi:uncharacterized protein (TIGR02594 family)